MNFEQPENGGIVLPWENNRGYATLDVFLRQILLLTKGRKIWKYVPCRRIEQSNAYLKFTRKKKVILKEREIDSSESSDICLNRRR